MVLDKELLFGKSCSTALEAPRHEVDTLIKRVVTEMEGLGQGIQIWEIQLQASGVSTHAILILMNRIDEENDWFETRCSDWEILLQSSRASKAWNHYVYKENC